MEASSNKLLWRFEDAITPTKWRSKQAQRMYEAAMVAEHSGDWSRHAVTGSVRCISHRSNVPELRNPCYGTNLPNDVIEQMVSRHISDVRRHADRMENLLAAYGPEAFRKRVAQMPAPRHPFDAEEALLSLMRDDTIDEIMIHGVRFVRDESRSFVKA